MTGDEILARVLESATNDPAHARCIGHEQPPYPHIMVSYEYGDPSLVHASITVGGGDGPGFEQLIAAIRAHGVEPAVLETNISQRTIHARFPRDLKPRGTDDHASQL